ncbi:sensor histidine kinase [Phenylobacterium soli]|uniref:histidine kinase n=1 Tax=Phenylobacterium soli TaxID=2170551 RepID=A0A328AJ53_9CAUL|nr:HWE histidine kinase domain-containing protein [Phenylobacterium soli]RAK54872.1 hypothetical protein DJ017_10215 [Phenylobacterium soli]
MWLRLAGATWKDGALPIPRPRDLIPRAEDVGRLVALYVIYTMAALIGLRWAVTPGGGSPIWPAAGVAFASMILGGPQLWPAVFLGRVSVALVTHSPQPLWADLLVAGASTLGGVVPTIFIQRRGGLDPRLGSLRDMAWLILGGGLLGALISALALIVFWASGTPGARLPAIAENWIFGYFGGVLLIAPLALTFSRTADRRMAPGRAFHLLVCASAVVLVTAHVFLQPTEQPIGSWQLFPVLVWAALAFNVQGASLVMAPVAAIAIWAASKGIWPQAGVAEDAARRVLMAQQFLAASGITTLLLAAVADERRMSEQLAKSERRLRLETAALEREVSDRVRAEEHQRLLINELNHRVKNTLATVQSIAAQTRRTATDPAASYESFIERILALSRAHDVLTEERWEGAELRAVAEGAVRPFEDPEGGGRFRMGGPPVWLEPQRALALAMALHELATNAAKYGALSVGDGKVSLRWTLRPDGEGLMDLEFIWSESDGPPVTPPAKRGFGSRLLERGLASELNGKVSVDYRPEGLVCCMRAKLPAADGPFASQAAAE